MYIGKKRDYNLIRTFKSFEIKGRKVIHMLKADKCKNVLMIRISEEIFKQMINHIKIGLNHIKIGIIKKLEVNTDCYRLCFKECEYYSTKLIRVLIH
jgi:hydroxymethylpyrimidine/phosphomethylpyrimidine kinase